MLLAGYKKLCRFDHWYEGFRFAHRTNCYLITDIDIDDLKKRAISTNTSNIISIVGVFNCVHNINAYM